MSLFQRVRETVIGGETMENKNQLAFSLNELSCAFAGCFISESYVQAFFLLLGLSVSQISLYGTLSYAAALLSYIAFGFYRPRNQSYFGMFKAWSYPVPLLPLALCLAPGLSFRYPLILTSAVIYQISSGFRVSALFSTIPMLFPRRYYGRLLARCSTIGCALGAAVSIVNAVFVGSRSLSSYQVLFGVSAALYLGGALSIRLMHPMEPTEEEVAHRHRLSLRESLNARTMRLLAPHLLRGIATGGFYYFVVASFRRFSLPASMQPLMVTVGVCGSVAGVYAFGWLDKRARTGSQIFFSNVICALCAVLTALNTSPVLFFGLYFLYMLTNNLTANAVPTGVIYSTSIEDLPFISSARMLVMSGASCIMIPVWGRMLDVIPVWVVMLLCGVIHIATGYIFKRQYTDPLK